MTVKIGGQSPATQARPMPMHAGAPPKAAGPVLSVGSSGAPVVKLQQNLTTLGYETGKADGSFGPITQKALKQFQEESGLPANGKFTPETREAMKTALAIPPMKVGDDTPEVAAFEMALKQSGVKGVPLDGKFTPELQAVVKKFQKDNGLAVTGEVNARTFSKALGIDQDGGEVFGEPLVKGSGGPAVSYVQKAMAQAGIKVAIDGDFGPKTQNAVKEYQKMIGLPVTGEVDQDTWNAFFGDGGAC